MKNLITKQMNVTKVIHSSMCRQELPFIVTFLKRLESAVLIEQMKEMFREMVIKKDPSTIPHYYHPEFMLYTNDSEMDYEAFLKSHQDYYATPIKYKIEFDEETLLEQGDKMAGRVWITTSRPGEPSTEIEVILIAQYKENKIYRLWELTYPDWSQLPAFKEK